MVQICPRCQRANPPSAVFCHYDGGVLREGGIGSVAAWAGQLTQEFVFPSGRRCRTFDELVQGCHYDWEDARELLQNGEFVRFFHRLGRADLARAAQEASTQADPDLGLINFVGLLPAGAVQGPKLDIHPRRLIVGPVRIGEYRPVQLTISNQGKGLLQGKVKVADGERWLKTDRGNGQAAIKTARDQVVTFQVVPDGLVAPQGQEPKSYTARLLVISNGGIAEVPLRLDVQVVPFERSPYQGVCGPRELAERMRTNHKPAVGLLESGEVARWFKVNGWTYPVIGRTAPGSAAVQQFFEALGLSKPPALALSDGELRFSCHYPEVVPGQVSIRTSDRKLVYTSTDSDVPWLRVTAPCVGGPRQAVVTFEVDSSQVEDDRPATGTLRIVANAGQTFNVRVIVQAAGAPRRPKPAPAPTPRAALPEWLSGPEAPTGTPVPVPVAPTPPPGATPSWASGVRPPAPAPLASRAGQPAGPEKTQEAPPVASGVRPAPAPAWVPPPPPAPVPVTASPPSSTATWVPPPPPAPPSPAITTAPRQFRPPEPAELEAVVGVPGLAQPLVVGALTGLLIRLALLGPADLFARLLGSTSRTPPPGTLASWLQAPTGDDDFLRLFVLASWWVGALVGVLLVWQKGGRITDTVCGLVAGAVAGLGASATVGCVLTALDSFPRALLGLLPGARAGTDSPVLGTLLWLIAVLVCWTAGGAVLGFVLGVLGRRGQRVLAVLAAPLSWALNLVGLEKAARFFALRGG